MKSKLIQWTGALALGFASLAAAAQDGPAYEGPGMMEGGPGYYGMGPGMMYGWGRNPRYEGMGPGMMYGWGADGGMGPWMMGYPGGSLRGLNLSDAQTSQVLAIADATRKRNLELATSEHDARVALRNALQGKRDRAAAAAAYKKLAELRRQKFENSLDAADQVDAVLTPAQRELLQKRVNAWGDPR